MKVFEQLLEPGIREQVKIDDMQLDSYMAKTTTEAIFIVRQYYAFV